MIKMESIIGFLAECRKKKFENNKYNLKKNMGLCCSKNNLKKQLLYQDNIVLTKEEFEDKIKSKFNITQLLEGFECLVNFIYEIRNQNLYPIDHNKLVSSNYYNLQFITIKNAILENQKKTQILQLINTILNEVHTDYFYGYTDKNFFYATCSYLFHHRNYLQMV